MNWYGLSQSSGSVFLISAALTGSLTAANLGITPLVSKDYRPKNFESDWSGALKRDPRLGGDLKLESLPIEEGNASIIIVALGDCTPCGLSRLARLRPADWKGTRRLFLLSSSPNGLEALREAGYQAKSAGVAVASEASVRTLNAFFTPRAYVVDHGRLVAIQSPDELFTDFVAKWRTP